MHSGIATSQDTDLEAGVITHVNNQSSIRPKVASDSGKPQREIRITIRPEAYQSNESPWPWLRKEGSKGHEAPEAPMAATYHYLLETCIGKRRRKDSSATASEESKMQDLV